MQIIMMQYYLVENHLTDRPEDFMAHTHSAGSYDKEELIKRILERGSTVTRADVLAVLDNLEQTIIAIIQEGSSISTSLFRISFSITGVFDGPMDSFDATRHQFHINMSIGTALRDAQKSVRLEKTSVIAPTFTILEVKDSVSGTVNGVLTPNGVLEIYGNLIKVAGTDPTCGVFFVNSAGDEMPASTIAQNKPSTVIVMIPALDAGVYNVKIVTQFNGVKELKKPRQYSFDHELTVV